MSSIERGNPATAVDRSRGKVLPQRSALPAAGGDQRHLLRLVVRHREHGPDAKAGRDRHDLDPDLILQHQLGKRLQATDRGPGRVETVVLDRGVGGELHAVAAQQLVVPST